MVDDVPEVLNVTLELFAEDINWAVNHSDYEHNMNITAQFSSDEGDVNLSSGKYDKIAAYIDGELRGVGEIELVPDLNKYAAFINVSSNMAGHNGSMIEAESYVDNRSLRDVSISDNGVSSMASRFRRDFWGEYDIYATKPGTFDVEFRVASANNGNGITVLIDGATAKTVSVPNTGNANTFTTIKTTLSLSEGSHKMRLVSTSSEFYLNWINFPQYHVRNAHADEVIKFRMWDGLNGIEYGAVEELTFFSDGVVGNAQNPFILHPAGGIQDMILAKGWTWISVNKVDDDMSVSKVLESITSPSSLNDITLKSQTAFSQYNKTAGWQGALNNMDVRSGYMVYLSNNADTLSMIGKSPATDITIPLNPKWNWIGYPKDGLMGANEILAPLTSNPGDIIKSQFEFAEYNANTGSWLGDLKFFEPGRGYKLFVSSPGNLNITKSGNPDEQYLKHEYNMTLTATIDFGTLPVSDHYSLKTYIGKELRGEIPLTFVDGLNQYMAFNMIHGDRADIGENVAPVLWDSYNQGD
ncbi:MAG: carbohydrate-binding protein [Draconibacterium sp.]|nr:carbohydrate-binding protein [Draconibacterium sp.]